jgi:hypothetical protein
MTKAALAAVALSVCSTACIVEAPTSAGREGGPAPARPNAAPPAEVKSGANFGDKVELTSVILAPSRGTPGEQIRAIANFKVLGKMDTDYMIFVHVEDVDGKTDRLNVDHAPARGALPTSRWEPGQMVRDEFEIPIPPGMPVRGLNLVLGFWDPKTDQRLALKNPEAVRNDGNNRVFVATIPVVPAQ